MKQPEIDLDKIYALGICQLDISQAAIVTDMEPEKLCNGDTAAAYMRGRLEGLMQVRKVLFDAAIEGDMQAAKEYLKIHDETQPILLK